MPRVSVEALLTPKVAQPVPKLDPLDTLGEREASVWRAVVSTMPADYFSSAQVRLLSAYCSAVCVREDIEAELAAERRKKRSRGKVITRKRIELKGWMETENRLARSMRLTHQSVYQHTTAFTAHKKGKASAADIARELNEDAFDETEA